VRTETDRRGPSRLQKRSKARGGAPTSFSRFLGLGGLAGESPAVLVHAGFGMQLLSMPVGEGGLGLSQGTDPPPCPHSHSPTPTLGNRSPRSPAVLVHAGWELALTQILGSYSLPTGVY